MKTFSDRMHELLYEAWGFIQKTIEENGDILFDLRTAIRDELEPFDQVYLSVYNDRYDTGETDETVPFILQEIGPDWVTGIRLDDYASNYFPCESEEVEDYIERIRFNELPHRSVISLADIVMKHYNVQE